MTIFKPSLVDGAQVPMAVTHPKHLVSLKQPYAASGHGIAELGNRIGAEAAIRSGTFEDAMLQALDKVSGLQQESSNLAQKAITEPDSVDIHDITLAQAKANMSLNITRNVLSRIVQGWKDLINTR